MKHARKDYDRIQDPLKIIPSDEPVFLVRGQDMLAGDVARFWADRAEALGAAAHIVQAAREHADAMDAWPHKKVPDMPFDEASPGGICHVGHGPYDSVGRCTRCGEQVRLSGRG